MRECCLWPPAMLRVWIGRLWLRPPDLLCFSSRGACGAALCRSGVTTRTALRRPAEVVLNVINGIGPSSGLDRHHVDRLAVGQRHVRLAPVAAGALAVAEGLVLAFHVHHVDRLDLDAENRSEEHTSELQSLMRISYAVFCLKKKKQKKYDNNLQYI